MPPARKFEDLIVWQKAYAFVLGLYRFTNSFPKHEIYGLTGQMRKAALSIPANIAEGFKKLGKLDKARFMNIAQGSLESADATSCCQMISATATQNHCSATLRK